ncbi:MAG: NAD-dependent epimerase/dehydratase family protein [Acidobacteria bacterium]|nr:NAD-dependent epimerase/dehydratase family protein [Acidobacteriota bacterium]
MRKPVVLISGAAGEIGHALIDHLVEAGGRSIVTLDLRPLEPALTTKVSRAFTGSILDQALLESIEAEFAIDRIFHLAALLSTRSEFTPVAAHEVNVRGTLNLLELAASQARSRNQNVVFFYPSSIAAYGVSSDAVMPETGWDECSHNQPITMYGCNKLYCEHLGRYYAGHYRQLDAEPVGGKVDFRSIRFPGLISAHTVPSGGTSDYAPEMIHAAAQGEPYECFVRPDTRIPFMAMPDAVGAILGLMEAPRDSLTRSVYNVGAFAPSAGDFRSLVEDAFPSAAIGEAIDTKRQRIVDSWPDDVDCSAARRDWGLAPEYDLVRAFDEYLVPTIAALYQS